MREDIPVFQELHEGGPHHTSELDAFARAMMAEDNTEQAQAAAAGDKMALFQQVAVAHVTSTQVMRLFTVICLVSGQLWYSPPSFSHVFILG